jgi:hypothetical protein
MVHKRSPRKLQERKIRGIILHGGFHDRKHWEIVNTLTRVDVMARLKEPVEVHLIPDLENGEVLIDLRGKGTLQKSNV